MGREKNWTVDSLHVHFISLLAAQEKLFDVARTDHAAWAEVTTNTLRQRIDDLHLLLNERNSTQQVALGTALASIEKAVDKAEEAVNKRFESVNEFRAQLAEQQATYITRAEVNAKVDAVHTELTGITNRNIERIQETADRVNKIDGKGDGGLAARAAILTVISTIVAVISVTLTLYIATRR